MTTRSTPEYKALRAASHDAYYRAVEADDAWGGELRRVFGAAACNARYTPAGCSTPLLARLHAAKRAADAAMREASATLFAYLAGERAP